MRRHLKNKQGLEKYQPKEPERPPEAPKGQELTPELARQMFKLQPSKTRLSRRLRELQGEAVVVQLDLRDGRWVLVVRGSLPRYSIWEGTPVIYKQGVYEVGTEHHREA